VTDTEVPSDPGKGDDAAEVGAPPPWWAWAAATALVVVAGVTIWAVQDDNGENAAPATTSTPVATVPTTTSTTTASTTSTTTSTTVLTTTTIEAVAAWIQEQFNDRYAQSPPPPGVAGPTEVHCTDTGPIEVGGVLGCELRIPTEPGFSIEDRAGAVIYVLDLSGRAAWTAGTDVPNSTEVLMADYQSSPRGLFCRDLLSGDARAYPFSATGGPASGFFWSLVYWSLEGEPDRMDADLNGIPCETLYAPDVVAQVLDGGPVPDD
jgi:hypothetical protein